MNWLMIVGGLAGVCLVTACFWVIINATYDEAYRHGFAAGREFGRREIGSKVIDIYHELSTDNAKC